ncbi:hypothetical protein R3P38DRAFT_2561814 [Favolaschia claudopus]|uniref:F-box domain-containing protein n=1 Tax=Favolaschia claudopus TaxID=2862362 RepID=A0AAW0A2V8_9AGAR
MTLPDPRVSPSPKARNPVLECPTEQPQSDCTARLPLELLSEIFTLCFSQIFQPSINFHNPPLALLRVSRIWRNTALATPSIWTRLRIDALPCKDPFAELCVAWVKRARQLPISLSLHGSLVLFNMRELLEACGPHLHELSLQIDLEREATGRPHRRGRGVGRQIDLLGIQFPSLRVLSIETLSGSELVGAGENTKDWLTLLHAAPSLTELHLPRMAHLSDYQLEAPTSVLIHPTLQTLRMGHPASELGQNRGVVLSHLTLPGLQNLVVSSISAQHLLSFLTRSSPPLRSLTMFLSSTTSLPEAEAQLCRILPATLTDLTLLNGGLHPLVEILNDSQCLLGLMHLSVWVISLRPDQCDAISRMLRYRSLRSFEVVYLESLVYFPENDEAMEKLREISQSMDKDGTEIRVITKQRHGLYMDPSLL